MSARLCVEEPPLRSLGDDLESFALVLLWLSSKYASNDMSPVQRTEFLLPFERANGELKAGMFRQGRSQVPSLALDSQYLECLLENLLVGYRWRYTKRSRSELEPQSVAPEMDERTRLDNPDWLLTLLGDALKDEAWKAVRDPSRKDQAVALMFRREEGRKRKSDCLGYQQVYIYQQKADGW
jgi:hypothetical protein